MFTVFPFQKLQICSCPKDEQVNPPHPASHKILEELQLWMTNKQIACRTLSHIPSPTELQNKVQQGKFSTARRCEKYNPHYPGKKKFKTAKKTQIFHPKKNTHTHTHTKQRKNQETNRDITNKNKRTKK